MITRLCQSTGYREEPTDTHQPYTSPIDERTITRTDAQIRGAAKRARASTEEAEAATEKDPIENTFSLPEMYQRLDELGVEQGR